MATVNELEVVQQDIINYSTDMVVAAMVKPGNMAVLDAVRIDVIKAFGSTRRVIEERLNYEDWLALNTEINMGSEMIKVDPTGTLLELLTKFTALGTRDYYESIIVPLFDLGASYFDEACDEHLKMHDAMVESLRA